MIEWSLLLYVFVREGKYDYEPMAHFHSVLRKSKTVHTTLTPGPSPACRARGGFLNLLHMQAAAAAFGEPGVVEDAGDLSNVFDPE